MEGRDGVCESLVFVLAGVEDADDALYPSVDLELGQKGERVERGVRSRGQIVEEEVAGRRRARREDGCVSMGQHLPTYA